MWSRVLSTLLRKMLLVTIRSESAYYVVVPGDRGLSSSSVVALFHDWLLSTGAGSPHGSRNFDHAGATS